MRCPHGTSSQQTTFCPDLYFRLFTYTAKGTVLGSGERRGGEARVCFRTNAVLSQSLNGRHKSSEEREMWTATSGGIGGKAWTASILAGKVADPSPPTRGKICIGLSGF